MQGKIMLKEIDEQPFVIRNIIQKYQNEDGSIRLDDDIRDAMKQSDRIYVIAAGTSYHAGLVGQQLIEKIAKRPEVIIFGPKEVIEEIDVLEGVILDLADLENGEPVELEVPLPDGVEKVEPETVTVTPVISETEEKEFDDVTTRSRRFNL